MTLSNSALISNRDPEIYSVWRAKWLTGQSIQSFDPRSQELPLLLFTKHKTKSNNQMITFWLHVLCTTCSYAWGDSRGHQSAEVESSPTSTRNKITFQNSVSAQAYFHQKCIWNKRQWGHELRLFFIFQVLLWTAFYFGIKMSTFYLPN